MSKLLDLLTKYVEHDLEYEEEDIPIKSDRVMFSFRVNRDLLGRYRKHCANKETTISKGLRKAMVHELWNDEE